MAERTQARCREFTTTDGAVGFECTAQTRDDHTFTECAAWHS